MFARSVERSSRIHLSAAGGDTELVGLPLGGIPAILFTVIGSLANALIVLLAFSVPHRGVDPGAKPVLRLVFLSHAGWGIAHLLPLTPFHLGQFVSTRLVSSAMRFAHAAASALLVLSCAILVVNHDGVPTIVGLSVFAAVGGIRALREAYRGMLDVHAGLDALLRDATLALSEGHADRARELTESGLATAISRRYREALWKLTAWSGIGLGDPCLAHGALLQLPATAVDAHLLASYLACCNRVDEAVEILEHVRCAGHDRPECLRLLADLLFRRGEKDAVLALARSEKYILPLRGGTHCHRARGRVATAGLNRCHATARNQLRSGPVVRYSPSPAAPKTIP